MNEIIDFLTANTTVAYVTAVIIFIITIVLLLKRLIGVIVTIVLLAFAILSGLSIANHDLFREILSGFKYEPEKTHEDGFTHFKNQLHKSYDELKDELVVQKHKLETLYDSYKKAPEKPATPTPTPEK